jgi:hypothetical protein
MEESEKGSRFGIWFLAVAGVPVLFAVGYTWFTLSWSYAKGERAGYLQKLSRKGWVCKTWEGELTLAAVPGSVPEKFEFTVREDDVAQNLNSVMGRRVKLHYSQHKGIPTSCFGETPYFITGVEVIE